MTPETFVKYFKEIYPNTYISLEEEFEKYYRRKARNTLRLK